MKISLNWINDFVDLSGVNYAELIKKFTLATAEVEDMYDVGKDISGVIVAKVVKCEDHPNSNHLHVLKVDTGSEVVDCICGAPNVREGMLVAFAKVGAKVIGGEIKETTIAGFPSKGMCCSKEELGLAEKSDGIWEIVDDLPLGTDIKKAYQIEDTIFEVDNKSLTNRPDLWGHYGIAREIAVLLNRPLKNIVVDDLSYYSQMDKVPVEIYTDSCLRYSCIKIANVTKKESPENVQIRLFRCGMRAINLLADLTNYVMLELGQPMHAFDGNACQRIEVRDLSRPTEFTTLDNQARTLDAGTMMICNEKEPVCIAGVMGGLNSEITENSNSVVLESACFDSSSIRKTAIKLGLRSEASNRYEKSLDPEMTVTAIGRYFYILRYIDSGVRIMSGLSDVYNRHYERRTISTTAEFINHYVGVNLSNEFITNTLVALGFKVKNDGFNLQIEVPSYRATKDVTIPVDIVEEVARIYGYDNIKPEPVKEVIEPVEQETEHLMEYDIKLLLAEKFGLNEIHSYIWDDEASNKSLNIETTSYVKILNSIVKENNAIRSEMMPTILKAVNENKNLVSDFGIFEVGRVVTGLDEEKNVIEKKHLGLALYSTQKAEKELYLKVKEIVESIADEFLNQKVSFKLKQVQKNYVHPINNAQVLIDDKVIGYISLLHPLTKNAINKKSAIAVLEIDFTDFAKLIPLKLQVKMPSK
ncbi:MAG TPA: phenylalanine--tRNA ligase subunit beta, partial [Clostridiales bacterium]|nr:phenylalanine--tRNA ligase subunit beta [Clostridiales bacterium]